MYVNKMPIQVDFILQPKYIIIYVHNMSNTAIVGSERTQTGCSIFLLQIHTKQ